MGFLASFLAGFGTILNFGFAAKEYYPFAFPEKAMGIDWEFVGIDIREAVKNHKNNEKN